MFFLVEARNDSSRRVCKLYKAYPILTEAQTPISEWFSIPFGGFGV